MTDVHLVLDPTPARRPTLPRWITDPRPDPGDRAQRQAARAAELAGLAGVLVPLHPHGLDAIVLGAALLREIARLQVTVALHPAFASPVYAAKLSASLQRFSGSRLAWLVEVDLPSDVARAQGDTLTGEDRYARADEFLTAARAVWDGTGVDFAGRFHAVHDGGLPASPRSPRAFPRVYVRGTSPQALALSAAHADVHLLASGEDPGVVPAGVARAATFTPERMADSGASRAVDELFVQSPDPVAAAFALGEAATPTPAPTLPREEAVGVG